MPPPSFLDRTLAAVTSHLHAIAHTFGSGRESESESPRRVEFELATDKFAPLPHITNVAEQLETLQLQGIKDVALSVDPILVCDFKRAALLVLEEVVAELHKAREMGPEANENLTGRLEDVAAMFDFEEDPVVLAQEISRFAGHPKASNVPTRKPKRAYLLDNGNRDWESLARRSSSLRGRIEALCFDINQRGFFFDVNGGEKLSIKIREVSVPGETFGLETWGAGLILSHLILTGRIPLPDCTSSTTKTAPPTVLDLGCGVGIAGIASGKVIQRQRQHHRASPTTNTSNIHTTDPLVFLTDYVPCVIANVQHNILLNDTSDLCSVRKLDWTNLDAVWTEQVDPAFPQMFDLIIASDVLYGEVTAGLLPNVLARLLRRPLAESKSKSTYTPRIHLLTPCRSSTWSIFHAQFARAMNELGIVEVPLHQPDTFSPPLSTPAAATSAAKRDYALDPYTYQTDPCAHQILTPTSACLRGAPQETWKAAMVDGYRWGEWRWKVDVAKM